MSASARALALVVAAVTLVAFGTPMRALWADPRRPWWTVYAIWALAIVALFWLARASRERKH